MEWLGPNTFLLIEKFPMFCFQLLKLVRFTTWLQSAWLTLISEKNGREQQQHLFWNFLKVMQKEFRLFFACWTILMTKILMWPTFWKDFFHMTKPFRHMTCFAIAWWKSLKGLLFAIWAFLLKVTQNKQLKQMLHLMVLKCFQAY